MLIGDALFIIVYRVCCIEFCFAACLQGLVQTISCRE